MDRRDFLKRMGIGSLAIGCLPLNNSLQAGEDQPRHYIPTEKVSAEGNKEVLERVWEMFDPRLHKYLRSIPIMKRRGTRTAVAHTRKYLVSDEDFPHIGVSPDWDNKAVDSKYWAKYFSQPRYGKKPDDPVFSDRFKVRLLAHEYLHMIEDHLGFDVASFFKLVASWYPNESSGVPKPKGGNRQKLVLWWNVYGQRGRPEEPDNTEWRNMEYTGQYGSSTPGVEEFAYIGSEIITAEEDWRKKNRLLEITDELVRSYEGILSPTILELVRKDGRLLASVVLPVASSAVLDAGGDLVVNLTNDGRILVNVAQPPFNKRWAAKFRKRQGLDRGSGLMAVSLDDLQSFIRLAKWSIEEGNDGKRRLSVLLRADKDAPWAHVSMVYATAMGVKIETIFLGAKRLADQSYSKEEAKRLGAKRRDVPAPKEPTLEAKLEMRLRPPALIDFKVSVRPTPSG